MALDRLAATRIRRLDAARRRALFRAVEQAETAAALFHRHRAAGPGRAPSDRAHAVSREPAGPARPRPSGRARPSPAGARARALARRCAGLPGAVSRERGDGGVAGPRPRGRSRAVAAHDPPRRRARGAVGRHAPAGPLRDQRDGTGRALQPRRRRAHLEDRGLPAGVRRCGGARPRRPARSLGPRRALDPERRAAAGTAAAPRRRLRGGGGPPRRLQRGPAPGGRGPGGRPRRRAGHAGRSPRDAGGRAAPEHGGRRRVP